MRNNVTLSQFEAREYLAAFINLKNHGECLCSQCHIDARTIQDIRPSDEVKTIISILEKQK
jgi:hypothetical protein